MDEPWKLEPQRVLSLLEALKEACNDLHTNPISFINGTNDSKAAIEAILGLETKAIAIFSADPNLHKLSDLLFNLKALIEKNEKYQGYGLWSLLKRQINNYKISEVAYAIESEIQAYVDRVTLADLVKSMKELSNEDQMVKALTQLEKRLSQGFDRDFQELVLRAKVFSILEVILYDSSCSKKVQEHAAMAIAALVKFNKNVFVGLLLMGPTIKALIQVGTSWSLKVLSSLIRFIRSPLVDEILTRGEIPKIVSFLCSDDFSVQVTALDCVLELAYIGRKEVIEAMLNEDLIGKLIELQRMEPKSETEMDSSDELSSGVSVETDSEMNAVIGKKEKKENFLFASCVSRFAIQLEVGEGLSPEEKTEFKLEILRRVKEASLSEAEVATITAEDCVAARSCKILADSTPTEAVEKLIVR